MSDVVTVGGNGTIVHGVASGVLSLSVSENSTVCFIAAHQSGNGSRVFVPPVALAVDAGGGAIALDVVTSPYIPTLHVCGVLPTLDELCVGDPVCESRGTGLLHSVAQ